MKQSLCAGVLGFAGLLACGAAAGWLCAAGCASRPEAELDLPLMQQAMSVIQRNYVDRSALDPAPITYGAISGMVDSLGDFGHSAFLSPEMVKELKNSERGELKGIGIEIQVKRGDVVIVAPLDNSPAQRAGLQAGEVILKINGEDIAGWPLSRVVDRISGPAGTVVRLSLLNPRSGATREVAVARASIKLHDVTWIQVPGTDIAHLRIASFDGNVARDFRSALKEIRARHLGGIALDLRDNPGGILEGAIAVASEFLPGGNVLLEKDANGRVTAVPARKGGLATGLPVVVLVNEGTASASEIVAGALRDSRGAELVGDTTFGTGTVLGEFKLDDGSALLLAIEEWLTPKGESFWHKGIVPQVKVSLPNDASPLFPQGERGMTPSRFRSRADAQLLRAIDILTSGRPRDDAPAAARSGAVAHP